MTEITLRRASVILNRIKKQTGQGDRNSFSLTRSSKRADLQTIATLQVDVDNISDRVENLRLETIDTKRDLFDLLSVGSRIRAFVAKGQARVGISDILPVREELIRKIAIVEDLVAVTKTGVYEREGFLRVVAALKQRLDNATTQAGSAPQVSTVVFNNDDRKALDEELVGLKRRQIEIDDQLADLNSTTTIDIVAADMEILRKAGVA